MNTEIKYILLVVIICAIIVTLSITGISCKCEKLEYKPIEAVSNEVTLKTTEEPKPDITEEMTEAETSKEEVIEKVEPKSSTNYTNCDVPANNTIKSYMDYRCITSTTSKQYRLQKSLAYTGDCGIRMVNGRYCVAVGSYYTTTIGQYIDIELENGKVIKGVLADCKDDKHTDSTNRINPNGSVVEFVVDTKALDSIARKMGDISYVNGWNSKIVNIKVYDKVESF